MKLRQVTVIALVLSFFITFHACSGSYASLDFDDLYSRADFIVKGTVIEVNTFEDSSRYYLDARIEVEKYFKVPYEGIAPPLWITVRSSEVKMYEGVAYETPPLVNFSVGEKVVIYLEASSSELLTPVGDTQGKFTLIGNSYVNFNGLIWRQPRPYSYLILGLAIVGAMMMGIVAWKLREYW